MYSRYRQPSALPYLIEQLKSEPTESYAWFYDEIMTWEIKPKFKRAFVEAYLCQLNKDNKSSKVIELYDSYLLLDHTFTLESNITRSCVLTAATKENKTDLIEQYSILLLNNQEDKESHKNTLLFLLKYYIEQQPNDNKAKQLLAIVFKIYPELDSNDEILKYKNILKEQANDWLSTT